jgi:hypothetical protein
LKELQDKRNVVPGTRYSGVFHLLPVTNWQGQCSGITGRGRISVSEPGVREKRKKLDKCVHDEDPFVQGADSEHERDRESPVDKRQICNCYSMFRNYKKLEDTKTDICTD